MKRSNRKEEVYVTRRVLPFSWKLCFKTYDGNRQSMHIRCLGPCFAPILEQNSACFAPILEQNLSCFAPILKQNVYLCSQNQSIKEMFQRDILIELRHWAEKKNRKPLVLRGARQVGKTSVIHEFGREFDNYLYVNLEDKNIHHLFDRATDVKELLTDLFVFKGQNQVDGRTLLFIDEIQNLPQAVALLRYFYEECPQVHVVAAGSLLENLIGTHISFPVGRVEYMAMHPCSFREFLSATGKDMLRKRIEENPLKSVDFHDKLMQSFNRYALIGGMPEVIAQYIDRNDIVELNDVYDSLLNGYRDDVEKYARNHTQTGVIRHILTAGWAEAASTITLGRFAGSEYKAREMGEAFATLEKAMLLELTYPVTQTSVPLLPDRRRAPKLLWLDSGLVNYAAGIQKEVFAAKDVLDTWRGRFAEHIVAQELLTLNNRFGQKRAFWVRQKTGATAEVDFVWQYESQLIPIEVKAGHNAHLRSLHSFIDHSNDCRLAVRVWSQPLSIDTVTTNTGNRFILLNIPFYLVGFLPRCILAVNDSPVLS